MPSPHRGGGRRVIALRLPLASFKPTPTDGMPANRSGAVARIAGVNIPTNKRVVIALQYIHGIGPRRPQEIMEKVGFRRSGASRN